MSVSSQSDWTPFCEGCLDYFGLVIAKPGQLKSFHGLGRLGRLGKRELYLVVLLSSQATLVLCAGGQDMPTY